MGKKILPWLLLVATIAAAIVPLTAVRAEVNCKEISVPTLSSKPVDVSSLLEETRSIRLGSNIIGNSAYQVLLNASFCSPLKTSTCAESDVDAGGCFSIRYKKRASSSDDVFVELSTATAFTVGRQDTFTVLEGAAAAALVPLQSSGSSGSRSKIPGFALMYANYTAQAQFDPLRKADGGARTVLMFMCGSESKDKEVMYMRNNGTHVFLSIDTPLACEQSSFGFFSFLMWLIIVLLVGFAIYMAAGTLYRRHNGAIGVDQIPHYMFFMELPGHVAEGARFCVDYISGLCGRGGRTGSSGSSGARGGTGSTARYVQI